VFADEFEERLCWQADKMRFSKGIIFQAKENELTGAVGLSCFLHFTELVW